MSEAQIKKIHTSIAGSGQWVFRIINVMREVRDDVNVPPHNVTHKLLFQEIIFDICGGNNELQQIKIITTEPIEFIARK